MLTCWVVLMMDTKQHQKALMVTVVSNEMHVNNLPSCSLSGDAL